MHTPPGYQFKTEGSQEVAVNGTHWLLAASRRKLEGKVQENLDCQPELLVGTKHHRIRIQS